MKEILKYIITNYIYKIQYPNSVLESFIGLRRNGNFEDFITIRKNVNIYGNTKIGAFTLLNRYTVLTKLVKEVGRFSSVGPNVYIGPGNHDYNHTTSRGVPDVANFLNITLYSSLIEQIKYEKSLINRETHIGHDVWIGGHSVILNGINVCDGAVIASNSVVTKDVEPYSIVGGVPAKFIKYRFKEKYIDQLIKIDFYNKPLDSIVEFIKQNPKAMVDKEIFIKCLNSNNDLKTK